MSLGRPALLQVEDLRTHFFTEEGVAPAVDGVSFDLDEREVLGLVGESGCGKSVTALSILRLVPAPGRIVGGRVVFRGRNLLPISEEEMRRLRGASIAMVFQEPSTSLNPVLTVGSQVAEVLTLHRGLGRREARREAVECLRRVGIPDPEGRYGEYAHRLSGGTKQRVMIAMALAGKPSLLLADEPTTALDVTIQAQILDLLQRLREETGMAILLITHNLGVVAEIADAVAVLYAGKVVERAPVRPLFARPAHPYTVGLFRSLPDLGDTGKPIVPIPGSVPPPTRFPTGCRFRDRCPLAAEVCEEEPRLREIEPGHLVACHKV
ncbi:MAG TPA: ABC transporter ATP-binding protein [Planctomycetota bacterium]|nr:ABC transporter ATP-binding protein [Planctomycetota bacterium]